MIGDTHGTPVADGRDQHVGGNEHLVPPAHLLRQGHRGAAHLLRPRDDGEDVVHHGGAPEVDGHATDHECKPAHLGMEIGLRHLHGPQELGPATFEEPEIARVIDPGRELSVYEIKL